MGQHITPEIQHITPEILSRAREGDPAALRLLFEAMTSFLLKLALRLLTGTRKAKVMPEELAQDLASDVIQLHLSKKPLETGTDVLRVLLARARWYVQDLDKKRTLAALSSGHPPLDAGFSPRLRAQLDLKWVQTQAVH